jgi:hypothetical protein
MLPVELFGTLIVMAETLGTLTKWKFYIAVTGLWQ